MHAWLPGARMPGPGFRIRSRRQDSWQLHPPSISVGCCTSLSSHPSSAPAGLPGSHPLCEVLFPFVCAVSLVLPDVLALIGPWDSLKAKTMLVTAQGAHGGKWYSARGEGCKRGEVRGWIQLGMETGRRRNDSLCDGGERGGRTTWFKVGGRIKNERASGNQSIRAMLCRVG
jgi:hypothetical protein